MRVLVVASVDADGWYDCCQKPGPDEGTYINWFTINDQAQNVTEDVTRTKSNPLGTKGHSNLWLYQRCKIRAIDESSGNNNCWTNNVMGEPCAAVILGVFLFAKEATKLMQTHHQDSLIFTSATASFHAKPPFTAFASAKAALSSLAQRLAREFSAAGIHVVHTIIDGVIEGDRAAQQFPQYYQEKGNDGLLKLDTISETYGSIHCQHLIAWTHELDLGPFKEPF